MTRPDSVRVNATVPAGVDAELHIYEDTTGDGKWNNHTFVTLQDGDNHYDISGVFSFGDGDDFWWSVEGGDSGNPTQDGVQVTDVEIFEGKEITASESLLITSSPNSSVNVSGTAPLGAQVSTVTTSAPNADVNPGSVTVTAIESAITHATPVPTFIRTLNPPASATTATTPEPSNITGDGTLTITVADSILTASSPAPGVNPGSVTITGVESSLTGSTPSVSLARGIATVASVLSATSPTPSSISGVGNIKLRVGNPERLKLVTAPNTEYVGLNVAGAAPINPPVTTLNATHPTSSIFIVVKATESTMTASSPSASVSISSPVTISAPFSTLDYVTPHPTDLTLSKITINGPVTTLTFASPSPQVVGKRLVNLPTSSLTATSPPASIGTSNWLLGGLRLGDLISEIRTQKELVLTFRVNDNQMKNTVSQFQREAGDVEVLVFSDGSFKTIDRSVNGVGYDLSAPVQRKDVRKSGTYYVQKYEQLAIDQKGDINEVQLTFLDDKQKEPTGNETDETRDASEWLFEFSKGKIATSRVSAQTKDESEEAVDTKKVELLLDGAQAQIMEASASYLDAVGVREVPDGDNFAEDNNPDGRNKVTVTAPSDGTDVLESGVYVVKEWKTEWRNEVSYRVNLELQRSGQVKDSKVSEASLSTPEPSITTSP